MDRNELLCHLLRLPQEEALQNTLDLLLKLAVRIVSADEGSLLLMTPSRKSLRFVLVQGEHDKSLTGKEVPLEGSVVGMVALARETIVRSKSLYPVEGDGKPQVEMAAPILLDDEVLGVMTAVSFQSGKSFSLQERQNYTLFASIAAALIGQQKQLQAVRCNMEELPLTENGRMESEVIQAFQALLRKKPEKMQTVARLLQLLMDM